MFYKIDVLKNFVKIYKKTPVWEFLDNKVAVLRPPTLSQRDSGAVVLQ